MHLRQPIVLPNQVWAGIEAKRWDLIIAEESSRLYRHHTKAGELFESAVDAGVRVICPSDDLSGLRAIPKEDLAAEAPYRHVGECLERRRHDPDSAEPAPADRVGRPLVPGE
ncbi:MAG: hypothetical protein ACKO4T_04260 [Planctomycetaceae bacterium]